MALFNQLPPTTSLSQNARGTPMQLYYNSKEIKHDIRSETKMTEMLQFLFSNSDINILSSLKTDTKSGNKSEKGYSQTTC